MDIIHANFSVNHEGFVICNVSLEEKDRFLFPIYRKQETKVTFVNRSELIARPFVPSAQFSSFVPCCHSLAAHSFIFLLLPILSVHKILFLLHSSSSQHSVHPRHYRVFTVFCVRRLVILYGRERNGSFTPGTATSALLRSTRIILPEWSSSMPTLLSTFSINFSITVEKLEKSVEIGFRIFFFLRLFLRDTKIVIRKKTKMKTYLIQLFLHGYIIIYAINSNYYHVILYYSFIFLYHHISL